MPKYNIENKVSGEFLGCWTGKDPEDAHRKMLEEAGCPKELIGEYLDDPDIYVYKVDDDGNRVRSWE